MVEENKESLLLAAAATSTVDAERRTDLAEAAAIHACHSVRGPSKLLALRTYYYQTNPATWAPSTTTFQPVLLLVLLLHITSNLTSSLIPRSSSLLSSEVDILSSNTKNAPQHWMIYIYHRYFNLQPCTKIQNCWYLLKLASFFNMCTRIQLKKILQLIL